MTPIPPTNQTDLQRWEHLLREQGFPTRFVPAGDEAPYDVLLIQLSKEEDAPVLKLELSFIPGMEEQLEGASLLQCFVLLPVAVQAEADQALSRLIIKLNSRLPLVGFGYLEAERMLCFRHVLMLPDASAARDLLVPQSTWMISYLLELFAKNLMAVAAGTRTLQEALDDNPFRALFP